MAYAHKPSVSAMWVGIILVVKSFAEVCAGRAWGRGGSTTDHDKNPKLFWLVVAAELGFGLWCVGDFLYKTH